MYWRIDDGGRIERVGEAKPERWALGKSVVEETLETWLGLHLDTILGLPVHLDRLTGPMSASEDIIAFDRVGRIHVFELKEGQHHEEGCRPARALSAGASVARS